jgi:hypothetical protein
MSLVGPNNYSWRTIQNAILDRRTLCHTDPAIARSNTMTEFERTSAGLQTVIPGCERRTLPRSTTRVDENGQGLLHFYKPSSQREQLERRADAPLLPKRGQRALAIGLFVVADQRARE